MEGDIECPICRTRFENIKIDENTKRTYFCRECDGEITVTLTVIGSVSGVR